MVKSCPIHILGESKDSREFAFGGTKEQMSTKRLIKYTATNSPHYSNAIICEQAELTGTDEIAQLRRHFQSMMWEQNEIAERKIREMKREAAIREEKLHRKLAEIHRSVETQRNSPTSRSDDRRRHRKKICSHHATPMRSGHKSSLRRVAADSNGDRKRPPQIVGKFDVYIVQRSNHVNRKIDSSVRRTLPSTSRSVRFCGEDTPLKKGKKRHRKRHKETEM